MIYINVSCDEHEFSLLLDFTRTREYHQVIFYWHELWNITVKLLQGGFYIKPKTQRAEEGTYQELIESHNSKMKSKLDTNNK